LHHNFKCMNRGKNLAAYIALGVVCLVWGTTYLALRVGVLEFPPLLFTALRQIPAGILLTGFMLTVGKSAFPSRETMVSQAMAGFLMISLGNGLVGWAEVHIPSGIAAVICSMIPIWVILINMAVSHDEKPGFPVIMGSAIALSGIVLIFGDNLGGFTNSAYASGIFLLFIASMGWSLGSVWMKRKNSGSDPFINAGLQMFFGGLFLIPMSLVFDDYSRIQWTPSVGYSLLYLIFFGSIAAYACYSYALKKLPVTIVTLYAYINPIVAIVLGWLMLGETLNLRIGIAITVTLAGIYVVNRGYQLRDAWRSQFSTNRQ
jgi:drug/metabolite transporter (DMT)-like permease